MDAAVDAALAASFAGLVAVGVTVAIERWGGVTGGLIGTLPSTIVPAALGIHAQAPTTLTFQEALYAVPCGMLLNGLFLLLWRVVPPKLPAGGLGARLGLMVAISLVAWTLAATGVVLALEGIRSAGYSLQPAALVATGLLVAVGAWACLSRPPAPKGHRKVGLATLAARGLLAAVAIGAAVVLAGVGGELVAGLAAVFPAIFLTTMVALWLSQGEAVPTGAVAPMMLGSASVSAFALLAAKVMPQFGPAAGASLSWVGAAAAVTLPAVWWLRKGRREAGGDSPPASPDLARS